MTFAEKICQVAEEGVVLLKNEDRVVPFSKEDSVAVFGRCQFEYYRSGMGSGGSVHVSYTTNLTDSLLELCASHKALAGVDTKLAKTYRDWLQKNPFDNGGGGWAAEPWSQKEMPLSDSVVLESAKNHSKAIFVIGRTAGEDKDNKAEKGSWYLSDGERSALEKICSAFENVCVVLNVSNIMDMEWIFDSAFKGHIKSVLVSWQGGQEGGRAIARILCGCAYPSGKLSDTIARHVDSYPSAKNFGNDGNVFYQEDIYVGYRYFSTFAPEEVRFPFGFGLSYTTFSVETQKASFKDDSVFVQVNVKNTGTHAGKEVVQVYVEAPQGVLGKPRRVLAAFAKTSELAAGSCEVLNLEFKLSDFASYDDSGATGNKSCFVLEEGLYKIFVGTDVQNAEQISVDGKAGIELEKLKVVQTLSEASSPSVPFKRIKPGSLLGEKYSLLEEDVPLSKINLAERIQKNLPKEIPFTGDKGIRFKDVINDRSKLNDFIAQIDKTELAAMIRGEGMMSQKVTVGIAAAYGGITQKLRDFGIPAAGCSDGPSGIRLDTGKEANLMPIGTLLACTWNPKIIEELYTFEGKELVQYEIDTLLGPGVNIHRSPLNGRNFEYYSEDPLLSGFMAISALRGLNRAGASGTIKHFAANSQEAFRRSQNSVVSERALREIYLKAFERAVKSGEVKSLMTSYNAINGHWSASNFDLVTTILRNEWGYSGLVMTDWWATMNDCVLGGSDTLKNTASLIRSGNDVYMVVDNDGAEKNCYGDNTLSSLEAGTLSLGELQNAARNILNFILDAPVSKRPLRPLKIFKSFTTALTKMPTDGKIAKEGEAFLPEGGVFYLQAEHDAMYNISGTYSKDGDDLSQSVSNIMIDGAQAASLECRSTAGIETTVNAAQVHLEKGFYKISLEHTMPGIKVKQIIISSEVITPVSLGVISI
ncbi:glycoside hydrolase family 3 C-terminal domain-containing protein [Treponema zioleckii]|uniref:glycoside hydrolase family 3 C-terminal domain-containing protein n=1 Tax=Treponema zioleckii TaxID=331680 RepID=UPI00168B32E9|nr:glycoside hydrolase family 3 N-terminal domain-containing protein [Treponema zioleckii]